MSSATNIIDFSQFMDSTPPAFDKTSDTYIQQVINCNKLQSNYLDLELIHNKNFRPGLGIKTIAQLNQSLAASVSTPSHSPTPSKQPSPALSKQPSQPPPTNKANTTDSNNKFEDFYQPAPAPKKITTTTGKNSSMSDNSYNDASNFNFEHSKYFLNLLADNNCSFIISVPGSNIFYSIGVGQIGKDSPKLSIWMTSFKKPGAIYATKDTIWFSCNGHFWRYQLEGPYDDVKLGKYDGNYIPRFAQFYKNIEARSLCKAESNGNYYFASPSQNCLMQLSETDGGISTYWKPLNWSQPARINGVCCRDGIVRYLTAFDIDGYVNGKGIGMGFVYDIIEDRIVCSNLCQPNSPRWFRNKLWVLQGGSGHLCHIDLTTGVCEEKAWVPGYIRGLSFVREKLAVVSCSVDESGNEFADLPVGQLIQKKMGRNQCGVYFIDMDTFDIIDNITLLAPIHTILDVGVINGVVRPRLLEVGDESNMRNYKIDYGT